MAGMMMKIIFTFGVMVSLTSATFPLLSSSSSYYPLPYSHSRSSKEKHEDNPYSHSLIPSYEPDYKDDFDDQYERSISRSSHQEHSDDSNESTNYPPHGPSTNDQVEETWARESPENNGPFSSDERTPVKGILASGKLNGIPVAGLLVKSSGHEGGNVDHIDGLGEGNSQTVSVFVSKPVHLIVGKPALISHPPTVGHHHSFGAHGLLSIIGGHVGHSSGGYLNAVGSLSGGYSPIANPYGDNPYWDARVQQRIHEAQLLHQKENEGSDFHEPPKPVHLRTPPVPSTGYPMFPLCRKTEPNFSLSRAPLSYPHHNLIHRRGDVLSSKGGPGLIYGYLPHSQGPTSNDAYVPFIPQPSPLLPPKPYMYGISEHSAPSSPTYQHYSYGIKHEGERNDQSDNQDEKSVPATLEEAKELTLVSQTGGHNYPIPTVDGDESQKSTAARIPDGNNAEVIPVIEVNTETDNGGNIDPIPTVDVDASQKSIAVTDLPTLVNEVNTESDNDPNSLSRDDEEHQL